MREVDIFTESECETMKLPRKRVNKDDSKSISKHNMLELIISGTKTIKHH